MFSLVVFHEKNTQSTVLLVLQQRAFTCLRSRLPLSSEVGHLPSKYLPSRIITS